MSDTEITFEQRGVAGVATLNRPKALNALTLGMVRALSARLAAWAQDPTVTRVVIAAAGDRAFSAGGDIRIMYDLGRAGRQQEALTFWREEYILNAAIKRYPKPYVSLLDGIVMGGGAGLSVHGSHRVAGDRFTFAMPESGIGFFPDVGATWFLPRMPGEIGTYCALTAARLGPGDGMATALATHRVPSVRFAALREALCDAAPVDTVLDAFAVPAEDAPVMTRRGVIDRLFRHDSVEDILDALDREAAGGADSSFAAATAATIRTKSPTSLKIALAQLRAGASLSFEACMETEYRIVSRIVQGHDFYEGVRAVLVDKDHAPHWRPATLDAVTAADVAHYFAPLEDNELVLA